MPRRADLDRRLVASVEKLLHNVSVASIRSWLKGKSTNIAAGTRSRMIERVARLIQSSDVTLAELEEAVIGIEEASGKLIYLYKMQETPSLATDIESTLKDLHIELSEARSLAKPLPSRPTLAYALLRGNIIRAKWSETQERPVTDFEEDRVIYEKITKVVVLIANLQTGDVEIRYDRPETFNFHSTKPKAHRYYFDYYVNEARDILKALLVKSDLQGALTKLIEGQPSLVRLHRGGHTNQRNARFVGIVRDKTLDIRDDEEYKAMFAERGEGWAYEEQSFYWLPTRSNGVLSREVFSHIDALECSVRMDADCWDAEADYAIQTIRSLQ
jgi:hypothetical protein